MNRIVSSLLNLKGVVILSEASELIQYIDSIREALSEVPAKYDANVRKMEELEKESNDLLHALELLDIDEAQAAEYAADMRRNRLERRRCKDENMVLKPLYDFIRQHPKLVNEVRICQQDTKKACGILKGRSYHPRVRVDLIEKFEKAKEVQQHG